MDTPPSVTKPQFHYDTLIVGNGALGLALGFELVRRGQRVAVVGPGHRETGASAVAGAMNGCFGEITHDLLASPHGRAKLELDIEATALWDDWSGEIAAIADVSREALRRKTGTTVILNAIGTAEIDTANFNAMRSALDEFQQRYDLLEEEDIAWISPQASSRSFRGLHLPDEHSVDTPAYLGALEIAFTRKGGDLIDGLVHDLQVGPREASSTARLADGRSISAEHLVLAAGAHSHALLKGALPEVAAKVPPMVSGYGVSALIRDVRTRRLDGVIRTPNRAFACGLHAVPRDDCIYLGATNILSNRPQSFATISDLHFLLDCAMKQLHTNLSSSRIARLQVGNRPVPVDGYPLVGKLPDTKMWMLTGTYRDGFHQSPLIAGRLARAIVGGDTDTLNPLFTPVRSPIEASTRERVVSAAVEHTLATGFEADWRIPAKWSNRLKADLRLKYAIAADELHDTFTPPPDILAFSVENPWLQAKLKAYYAHYA